jgi:cytochrome c oxidase assembly factor CtaG
MQWWCSAQSTAWEWVWQPYPGVWIFVAVLAASYLSLQRAAGEPETGGSGHETSRAASFFLGLVCLWIALDWPVGALGAGYLASAHMLQFLLIALVAPPLVLHGIPVSAYGRLERIPVLLKTLRFLTHPLIALAVFNLVLISTHWPSVVDNLMSYQVGSFVLDMAWLGAGLVLWWPLVAPIPRRPGFTHMYKIGYLILATILNTPAFALLTFSDLPLYATFELAPPVHGVSTRDDQRIAGLMMKIGGGVIFWIAITVLFFKWYLAEHGDDEVSA